MARQSAIFTPGGLVELNETATPKQGAVSGVTDVNQTVAGTTVETFKVQLWR